MKPLRIALCQTDIEWRQPLRNLERTERLVAQAEADLVLLPEMFATGFDLHPSRSDKTAGEKTAERMGGWAVRYGKAVAGSIAVEEDGSFRNRMLFAKPSGEMLWYDKRHLFAPGGEDGEYTPGDRRVTVEYMGWRLRLLVCYDLRFPVWCRNVDGYDALLCCASWSAARREAWRTLLRARAVENQCYAIGVNRTGEDPSTRYAGDSMAVDFLGRTMADAGNGERTLVATLDAEELQRFRAKFPAWRDADDFMLRP